MSAKKILEYAEWLDDRNRNAYARTDREQWDQLLSYVRELAWNEKQSAPLSEPQIETLRASTFSVDNPFCPVDRKSMIKAVRAAEVAHGIK